MNMSDDSATAVKALLIKPEQGRLYSMGSMTACFKADCEETGYRTSISEWWLEANTGGPSIHLHPEEHVYYVLEGELSVYVSTQWHVAHKGTYIYIPGGTEHSFENRSSQRCGFISINTPGGFESEMPAIVEWFEKNPLGNAGK